jgi:catechol 2,3-dioxygenase-like lactoylglutathione lyase family enzyme
MLTAPGAGKQCFHGEKFMANDRVTSLRYVAVAVPDFAAQQKFLKDTWGLTEVATDGDLAYFAAESAAEPFVYRLRKGDERRLDLVAVGVDDDAAVDAFAQRLGTQGVKLISEPHRLDGPGGGYGFRFFDIDGRTLEISSGVVQRATRELARGESIPATLSHVVMHSPDINRTVKFYEEKLGFRVSDWLGGFMCFLRCNEVHHVLAFIAGPPSLNHVAFEMRDINEMMRGAGRLLKSKLPLAWGPGRHVAGDNCFCYFVDPSGNVLEYTAEVERVDFENWQATVFPPGPNITDQWGTSVLTGGPETMPKNGPDPGLFKAPPV